MQHLDFPANPEILTIDQAADLLQLSKFTVYEMAASKRVPAFKIGNRWRFLRSQLLAWAAAQANANIPNPS